MTTKLYDYETLYRYLQFDNNESELPKLQHSINAITAIEQRTTLQKIRDMKVNQEKTACTRYSINGEISALQACKRCISVLNQLEFNTSSPRSTELLHPEDTGENTSEIITFAI